MAKTLGSSGVLTVNSSGSQAAIAYVKNVSFNISADEVESTDNDNSNGWKTFLMGNRTGTFSFTCNAAALVGSSPEDAEQKAMVTHITQAGGPTQLTFVYEPHGVSTDMRVYTFDGFVQEVTHNMSNNQVVELSVTVRVTGAIVPSAHA